MTYVLVVYQIKQNKTNKELFLDHKMHFKSFLTTKDWVIKNYKFKFKFVNFCDRQGENPYQ